MTRDLIVIGGGPAGIGAALSAAEALLDVTLIDEQPGAGGQVYRPLPEAFSAPPSPDSAIGDELRRRLKASAVETKFERKVWLVGHGDQGFEVRAVGADGPETYFARRLIAATGTSERIVPVPGWTRPGVMGLAATTILLKAQHMLPGRNTIVAGQGPLLAAVAVGILKGGGKIAAVVDLASTGDWLRAMPALVSRPDLLARGAGWLKQIRRARVPILTRHAIVAIEGDAQVTGARVAPVDASGAPIGPARLITCDSVALGNGLVPATEIPRVLGAAITYDADRGGWITQADDFGVTSIAGLYVAGDGAGIAGAAAALERGRLAGLAAARDAGRLTQDQFLAAAVPIRAAARRATRFGAAMARLMAIRPGQVAAIASDTIVCRCEEVTRGDIDEALAAGARDVNQLKSWTRCGMGPCQARICGDVVGALIAPTVGGRAAAQISTARTPLRPVSYATLTGTFDYESMKLPPPAPS